MLNHSCDPNAIPIVFDGTFVSIIHSKRKIKAGEEICFSYDSIWCQRNEDEQELKSLLAVVSNNLKFKWGIFCPDNCVCHDSSVLSLNLEVSRLKKVAYKSGSEKDFETSLAASKEILHLCNTKPHLIGCLGAKQSSLFDAFSAASLLKGRRDEAMGYIKEVNKIFALLDYPGSLMCNHFKGYEERPWTINRTVVKEEFQRKLENLSC